MASTMASTMAGYMASTCLGVGRLEADGGDDLTCYALYSYYGLTALLILRAYHTPTTRLLPLHLPNTYPALTMHSLCTYYALTNLDGVDNLLLVRAGEDVVVGGGEVSRPRVEHLNHLRACGGASGAHRCCESARAAEAAEAAGCGLRAAGCGLRAVGCALRRQG